MIDNKNNSGNWNSGYKNSGNRNSGDWNSGNRNSGYKNSGNYNSGNSNRGNSNSGNKNSGNYNSGNSNRGNSNSGNYNNGNWNSGFFNTNEPTVRLFNKETTLSRDEINLPYLLIQTTKWISELDMTDDQKKIDPDFHVKGGTLLTFDYKEAWARAWKDCTEEVKQQFLDLPNFDSKIFEEITGIDVGKKEVTCEGKIVEIEGKKYKLTEI